MLLDLFLIGLMILINGIFAMAEIAVIAAQPTKLRVSSDDGDHDACLLLGIQKNLGKTSPGNPAISLEEVEVAIQQGASESVMLPFEESLIYKAFA